MQSYSANSTYGPPSITSTIQPKVVVRIANILKFIVPGIKTADATRTVQFKEEDLKQNSCHRRTTVDGFVKRLKEEKLALLLEEGRAIISSLPLPCPTATIHRVSSASSYTTMLVTADTQDHFL